MINDLIEISKQAGKLIKEGFGKNLQVNYKTNEINLVTQFDKASEKLIIDFIKNKFPTHSILAEEGGGVNNDSEYLWVVDPLDGTTNFTHGLPIFSVSIGVQKNNNTIAGELIVEEAGGLVTDFECKQIDIYSKKILCTNNKIHNQIIDVMNELSY